MKKVLFSFLALAVLLSSCKKDETVRPSGSSTFNGTFSVTSVALPNNFFDGKSVAAAMPESAILSTFRMTKDEFLQAWSNGQIKFGACQNNSQSSIEWGSTTGQGTWGHCFDINGGICSPSDAKAVIAIEGTTSPFNYKVYGIGKYYEYTGKTIECQQVFQYSDELMTQTLYVPWKVSIQKGDPIILKSAKPQAFVWPYDKGAKAHNTALKFISNVEETIGVDPDNAPIYAMADGKVLLDSKGTELYFDVNGKVTDKKDAALVLFYNKEDEDWCFRFTENEEIEGIEGGVKINVAFVNETTNFAYSFTFGIFADERAFVDVKGSFSMTQGIVFQVKMLNTGRQREETFDLPADTYIVLEQLAKQRGQSGVTLAQLILGGYVTVCGPMATKEESTATPYGHWFNSSAKVCKSGDADAYSCFVLTPQMSDGHCLVTLKNVPGADKVGDKKMFQQTLHSTVLGLDIPITYIVSVEE